MYTHLDEVDVHNTMIRCGADVDTMGAHRAGLDLRYKMDLYISCCHMRVH